MALIRRPFDNVYILNVLVVETIKTPQSGTRKRRDNEDTSLATVYKDVETEQCRYVHFEDADKQYLDVFVYRASSDAGFKKVDISGRILMGSPRKLDIGDISFLDDIDSRTIKVAASKGRTVFELSLNSKDAQAKPDQLIELARVLG